jgi:hypothetical protein
MGGYEQDCVFATCSRGGQGLAGARDADRGMRLWRPFTQAPVGLKHLADQDTARSTGSLFRDALLHAVFDPHVCSFLREEGGLSFLPVVCWGSHGFLRRRDHLL